MSEITFHCPHCRQSLEAPPELFGQEIDCPSCNKRLQVPSPQSQPIHEGDAQEDQKKAANANTFVFACPLCSLCMRTEKAKADDFIDCPSCKKRIRVPFPPETSSQQPAPATENTRPCPFCSKPIFVTAIKCKHCGNYVTGKTKTTSKIVGVLFAIIVVLGLIFTFRGVSNSSSTSATEPTARSTGTQDSSSSAFVKSPQATLPTTGEILIDCSVTRMRGDVVLPQGWVQLLSGSMSLDNLHQAIGTDSAVADAQGSLNKMLALRDEALALRDEARREGLDTSDIDTSDDGPSIFRGMLFTAIADVIHKQPLTPISEGTLGQAQILFKDIAPGTYIFYGAGVVSDAALGFLGSVTVEAGKRINVTLDGFYASPKVTDYLYWSMFGEGTYIKAQPEWQNLYAMLSGKQSTDVNRTARENRAMKERLRREGIPTP